MKVMTNVIRDEAGNVIELRPLDDSKWSGLHLTCGKQPARMIRVGGYGFCLDCLDMHRARMGAA